MRCHIARLALQVYKFQWPSHRLPALGGEKCQAQSASRDSSSWSPLLVASIMMMSMSTMVDPSLTSTFCWLLFDTQGSVGRLLWIFADLGGPMNLFSSVNRALSGLSRAILIWFVVSRLSRKLNAKLRRNSAASHLPKYPSTPTGLSLSSSFYKGFLRVERLKQKFSVVFSLIWSR